MAGIHRDSEVTRLTTLFQERGVGLSIVSISGPGGVGKSFLLNHVLETLGSEQLGYLVLRADASNPETRADFFGVVEQICRSSLPPPADRSKDYFPHVRGLADNHRRVVAKAVSAVAKAGGSSSRRERGAQTSACSG